MWLPGPLTLMVAEFLLRQGTPLLRSRLTKTPPSDVLFEGEARLEHGGEPVNGILSVTPSALVFTPNTVRARHAAVTLPLDGIDEVAADRSRIFGLIPASRNALKVRSERGIFRFRVDGDDRDTWLRQIEVARGLHRVVPLD